MSAPPHEGGRRRTLLVGVIIGVLIPVVSFFLVVLALRSADDGGTITTVGTGVWALLAFSGTLMIGFDRTRRLGLGILLGLSGVILVGAGTCTAVVLGGAV